MLYTRAVIKTERGGKFLSDGINLMCVLPDRIDMYEKKTGYRKRKLLVSGKYNLTSFRQINDDLYAVSNIEGTIVLYKNWQMTSTIKKSFQYTNVNLIGSSGYYTDVIGYDYLNDIVQEYIIDDDVIKIVQYQAPHIGLPWGHIVHVGPTHITTGYCGDTAIYRIDKKTDVCTKIYIGCNIIGKRIETSYDNRYLFFKTLGKKHKISLRDEETFVEIKTVGKQIYEVFGLIDGLICVSDTNCRVRVYRGNEVAYNHCSDGVEYIHTSDGLICDYRNDTARIKNTKWQWRDFDIQDLDVQELAITIITTIRRASNYILNRDIVYYIATIVMENYIPIKS